MATRRICFVISPIGDKDSDVRRHADNLMRRIIGPSLSNLNFDVVRVDQSYANSRISDEIVGLIKNSELCIVDSSGYNANVMYELGRRHETNKPLIIMRPPGQSIVFDLKDIKHVDYDLDDVDSVIDSQTHIRGFLEEFERQGFMSSDARVSIDSIAVSINRVESRIDDLAKVLMSGVSNRILPLSTAPSSNTAQIVGSLGLERGFLFCLSKQLVREAEEIFSLLEPQSNSDIMLYYLGMVAGLGSRKAYEKIQREAMPIIRQIEKDTLMTIVSGFVYCANRFNDERNAVELLQPFVDMYALEDEKFSSVDKAFLLNQVGKLYGGMDSVKEARRYYERARELNPEEPAYIYNVASNAFARGEIVIAEQLIDETIESYLNPPINVKIKIDHDHLALAVKIYHKNNQYAKMTSTLQLLRDANPMLADYIIRELNIDVP